LEHDLVRDDDDEPQQHCLEAMDPPEANTQPEPQGPAPTPDDFCKWWRETGLASSARTPEMLLIANAWAEHWAARCLRAQPEPQGPTDEELDELWAEIDGGGAIWAWQYFARAVLARWGTPANNTREEILEAPNE
jgi:hypothetical protein